MPHEIGTVEVQGRRLQCVICSHDMFWQREVDLSTPVLSFFTMDEASRAHCAVCARCGYVHMFIPPATVTVDAEAPAGGPQPQPA